MRSEMAEEKYERGTIRNPFEVGDRVRTKYFRGAAPEKELHGTVVAVDRWAGSMSFGIHKYMRYKVRWDGVEQHQFEVLDWVTCRKIEALPEKDER
jgi:hypothetical protein